MKLRTDYSSPAKKAPSAARPKAAQKPKATTTKAAKSRSRATAVKRSVTVSAKMQAPGQKKKAAGAKSARAFAPGQMKKAAPGTSARVGTGARGKGQKPGQRMQVAARSFNDTTGGVPSPKTTQPVRPAGKGFDPGQMMRDISTKLDEWIPSRRGGNANLPKDFPGVIPMTQDQLRKIREAQR